MDELKFEWNKDKTFLIDDIYCKYFIEDKNKPIVITFGADGKHIGKNDIHVNPTPNPWGFTFVKSQRYNIISFSTTTEHNWYKSDIFILFLEKLSRFLNLFPKKVGYGSSMGGYAVSAFSNLLNLDNILIMQPISTLYDLLVPFETRYRDANRKIDWKNKQYNDGAITNAKGYVIYDPIFALDSKHAIRYSNLIHLKVPGVGHSVPETLRDLKMLKDLFISFVREDSINKVCFYKGIRNRRSTKFYYDFMLSNSNKHLTEKRKEIINKYKNRNSKLLNKKTLFQDQDVNLLRDSAMNLENINIKQAYNLMLLAHKARPNGMFIKKKLGDFEKKLNFSKSEKNYKA